MAVWKPAHCGGVAAARIAWSAWVACPECNDGGVPPNEVRLKVQSAPGPILHGLDYNIGPKALDAEGRVDRGCVVLPVGPAVTA